MILSKLVELSSRPSGHFRRFIGVPGEFAHDLMDFPFQLFSLPAAGDGHDDSILKPPIRADCI
jgi:hypothetical protein